MKFKSDDGEGKAFPRTALIVGLVLYFSLPLWAWLSGWAELDWGPRAFRATPWSSLVVQLVGFFLAITTILVWPMAQFVWSDVGKRYSPFQAVLFSTIFLSLPLIGYGYFLGGASNAEGYHELLVSVVPAVLFSSLLYERTRNVFVWGLALSALIFFPFFVLNEILGPVPTYFNFLAHHNRFAFLRETIPLLSVASFAWFAYSKEEMAFGKKLDAFTALIILMLAYALAVHVIAPLRFNAAENGLWEAWWVLYGVVLIVMRRRGAVSLKVAKGLALTLVLGQLLSCVFRIREANASFWELQSFSQSLIAGLVFFSLFKWLQDPLTHRNYSTLKTRVSA